MTARFKNQQVFDMLRARGYNYFTGVPCSLFGDFFDFLQGVSYPYLAAPREDVAMALACGAALAGRKPVVLMQNSGLGLILNAVFSLNEMYGTHALILMTWRGMGPDAPEHVEMGKRLPALLDAARIPSIDLTEFGNASDVFFSAPRPVCALVKPGDLA